MTNVTPLNYNLEFDIDLNNSEFNGREVIGLTVENETRTIVLNSADLKILECSLKFGKQVIRLSSSINVEKQELKLRSPKPIRGKAELMIRFRGLLTDDLAGLYRSSYRGSNLSVSFWDVLEETLQSAHLLHCQYKILTKK